MPQPIAARPSLACPRAGPRGWVGVAGRGSHGGGSGFGDWEGAQADSLRCDACDRAVLQFVAGLLQGEEDQVGLLVGCEALRGAQHDHRGAAAALKRPGDIAAINQLSSVPGWGPARVVGYAAAVGELGRWTSHAKVYRAAGLDPAQYESAGRRRGGSISREGSVELRRALLVLGLGLWQRDAAARSYGARLQQRGKPGGIIITALARRANKIAFAMVPTRPSTTPPAGH